MNRLIRRAAQPCAASSLPDAAAPAAAGSPACAACARCKHWDDSRHTLEQRIAGLVVFGSGFGASVAASRLCTLHDRLVSPGDRCAQFAPNP
jgi:hypothetical protein